MGISDLHSIVEVVASATLPLTYALATALTWAVYPSEPKVPAEVWNETRMIFDGSLHFVLMATIYVCIGSLVMEWLKIMWHSFRRVQRPVNS
jgi:lysylphosphatidylglycerol synthetase-like protein (DUF2156 family)